MSIYQFVPYPDVLSKFQVILHEKTFTDEQIEQIIKLGDALPAQDAVVSSSSIPTPIKRKCKVSWMTNDSGTYFIYNTLARLVNETNTHNFRYDLFGFVEDFQYTVYDETGAHYNWHCDNGNKNVSPRKLSLVLQLSDPNEYEGGELEVFTEDPPIKIKKEKGLIAVFPSYVMHRVTPVTKGIRKTLVVWAAGKPFQ